MVIEAAIAICHDASRKEQQNDNVGKYIYSIHGDKVYVEGIYHDLQDYENILQ